MEMQKSGYAAVGEFHYLHHRSGGNAYDNPAELSDRIIEAANLTGIGLTRLPVLYTYAGAKKQPLAGGQLRFGNSVDGICNIVSMSQKIISFYRLTHMSALPHIHFVQQPRQISKNY